MPSACKALAGPRRTTRWMRGRLNEAILIPGGRAPSPDPEIVTKEGRGDGNAGEARGPSRGRQKPRSFRDTGKHREEREDEQEDGEYGGSPHILSATI